MKKIVSITIIALSVFLLSTAFNKSQKNNAVTIYERQQERLNSFTKEVQYLSTFLHDDNITEESLQGRFLRVRAKYKAWEYLVSYDDPDFVKMNINGAPLPKITPNVANLEILQPRGMQVLDELLFSGDFEENLPKIRKQVHLLIKSLDEYKVIRRPIYDRIVLEAMRVELVSIFTLSLTGFDVPASGNSINDAITVLETMRTDLELYRKFFDGIDATQSELTYATFDSFIEYLKQHNNFDDLDRLFVLRTYVNPLYASIYYLHKKSGIEMLHEVVNEASLLPFNHESTNLFANDFLNYRKYIQLPKDFATDETILLGKTLFYDPILSSNLERSCASCHHPEKAFTDGQLKSVALGFDGTVDRNAPTLINCVYNEKFFHDMRAEALEDQIEHVLVNRKEFDTDMTKIEEKLRQSEEYKKMFEDCFKAYNGEKINGKTISFAISAYVSSLRGFNSKFDKYVRGEINSIEPEIRRGFNLFMGKAVCGTCHFAPTFNGTVPPLYRESESEVLGVPEDPYVKKPVLDKDRGRAAGKPKERVYFFEHSFKTPTVRNVALTAPYMHNGAYKTLDDVVDFYNEGGGIGMGIILEHQTLPFDSLSLNKQEVKDIVAFMNALTDTTGMTSKPAKLPTYTTNKEWNDRKIGGAY